MERRRKPRREGHAYLDPALAQAGALRGTLGAEQRVNPLFVFGENAHAGVNEGGKDGVAELRAERGDDCRVREDRATREERHRWEESRGHATALAFVDRNGKAERLAGGKGGRLAIVEVIGGRGAGELDESHQGRGGERDPLYETGHD